MIKRITVFLCIFLAVLSQSVFGSSITYNSTIKNTGIPLYYANVGFSGSTYSISYTSTRDLGYPLGAGGSDTFTVIADADSTNSATIYYMTTDSSQCTGTAINPSNCAGCVITLSCTGSNSDGTCKQLKASGEVFGTWSGGCGAPVQMNNAKTITYTMG